MHLPALAEVWQRLARVRSLEFVAQSVLPSGWNGRGSGAVGVEHVGAGALTFTESGTWLPAGGRELDFFNVFRWSLVEPYALRLEHLRFGPNHPVHLFDLTAAMDDEWQSEAPHVCREDCYTARLTIEDSSLRLCWTVVGPRKQQAIDYVYFC